MSGPLIGNHQVLETLAQDLLGESLLAVDRTSGVRVVLRRLSSALCAVPGIKPTFLDMAQRLKGLSHPALPQLIAVISAPEDGGPPYLVTEYLTGVPLAAWLEFGEGPIGDPLAVAEPLAEVLAAAQQRGLIHGDLHPGKVLMVAEAATGCSGVRLLDLGLGALLALWRDSDPAQHPKEPLSEYQAPELLRGQGGDGPSDVFALGAMLQRMLQAARITVSTAPTILPVERQRAATLVRDLPELLRAMLLPDPRERPPMVQVAEALHRVLHPVSSGNTPKVRVSAGQLIGSYRLLRQLGGGGMGVVFEASHDRLSRRAAIKVLRPELSQDPEMVRRFFNEAEAVNLVRHPGIVNVFEYGQLPDQTVYIVMEYLEGESLHRRMSRCGGRLGIAGLRLVRQVASALAATHARGVVHRDLKPENIMVVDDAEVPGGERVKVLDFGIAKMSNGPRGPGAEGPATQAGQTLGTPVYMAPEQSRDAGRVDERADVYSLGVILYEALAGRPPFWASALSELLSQHLYTTPPSLRELDPALPVQLEALVMRMLAKEPAGRPSMAQVAAALDKMVAATAKTSAAQEVRAPGAGLQQEPGHGPLRRWLWLIVLGAALAGAALASGTFQGLRSLHVAPPYRRL